MTRVQGEAAEVLARQWLESRGLRTMNRNFLARGGEIDLIMRDGNTLVMLEVRHRTRRAHGDASESITPAKQQRLIRAAHQFLQQHPRLLRQPVRFDVLALDGPLENPRVQWLKDAFRLN